MSEPKKVRIYSVTQYTSKPLGYRLVPFNGMQMHYERTEVVTMLTSARSERDIARPAEGRRQEVKFLAWAPSVADYENRVAAAQQAIREAQMSHMQARAEPLVKLGLSAAHTKIVAENVYRRRQAKRKYYYALHDGAWQKPWEDRERAALLSGDNFRRPLYRLSAWLKVWGYAGEVRAAVERWCIENRNETY